jgi:hypothetical protein
MSLIGLARKRALLGTNNILRERKSLRIRASVFRLLRVACPVRWVPVFLAPLAQLAEQVTLNHWVVGSIPTRCMAEYQGVKKVFT